MIRFISRSALISRFVAIAVVFILCASLPTPAFAQDPEPPPPPDPITQIFQYVIQFPTDSLVEALTQAIQAILSKSIEPLEQVFSASLAKWVTASPGIISPGGGIVDGVDVMTPAWNLTSRIAILLWPLTLALTAVIAAKDVVAARSWGIGDLKQALGTWLIAVILSATSLYWMDLANRFANATTSAILNLSFTGTAGFDPNLLTTILIGSAVIVLGMTGLGIIIAIIILIVGISVLAALILQFLARFALLYVLVTLAPIVIILGVIPPLRWFTYTWMRGFVLVLTIGPVNALLLKLVMVLGVRGISNDPITAFVNFMAAAGVLSALLTVNYTLIRFVFGAIGQVAQRAVGTVTAVGTLALGAVAGVAAAGAVGGAGAAAGASGGSSLGGGGGILSNPRALGTGLETAGSVMARSGGFGRGFGAALWGVGNAMRQSSRNGSSSSAASSQRAPSGANTQSSPNGSNAPTTGANQSIQSSSTPTQTPPSSSASGSSSSAGSNTPLTPNTQTSQTEQTQRASNPNLKVSTRSSGSGAPVPAVQPSRTPSMSGSPNPSPRVETPPTLSYEEPTGGASAEPTEQTQSLAPQSNLAATIQEQDAKTNVSSNRAPASSKLPRSQATKFEPTTVSTNLQSPSTPMPMTGRF